MVEEITDEMQWYGSGTWWSVIKDMEFYRVHKTNEWFVVYDRDMKRLTDSRLAESIVNVLIQEKGNE